MDSVAGEGDCWSRRSVATQLDSNENKNICGKTISGISQLQFCLGLWSRPVPSSSY